MTTASSPAPIGTLLDGVGASRWLDTSGVVPLRERADLRWLLRLHLLELADHQQQQACEEAARVPYWSPTPSSVSGHRAAAAALRRAADELITPSPKHEGGIQAAEISIECRSRP
jgi:hypothetical protein